MIKFIGAAIWICAVTIGAVIYSFQSSSAKAPNAAANTHTEATLLGGLDYVKTEVISVPVLKKDGIEGYFLGRFVYTVEPEKVKKLVVPAEAIIVDEVYSYLYANPLADFTRVDTLDLDAFRNGIRDSINKRVGEKLVHEVMIEQIDFLSKAEIRDSALRRKVTRDDPKPKSPPGGHAEPATAPAEPPAH